MSEHIVIKGLEAGEDAFGNNIHDCYQTGNHCGVKVWYKKFATPWSDYLFASPEELEAMLVPTVWQIDVVHHDPESHQYIAQIIRKP